MKSTFICCTHELSIMTINLKSNLFAYSFHDNFKKAFGDVCFNRRRANICIDDSHTKCWWILSYRHAVISTFLSLFAWIERQQCWLNPTKKASERYRWKIMFSLKCQCNAYHEIQPVRWGLLSALANETPKFAPLTTCLHCGMDSFLQRFGCLRSSVCCVCVGVWVVYLPIELNEMVMSETYTTWIKFRTLQIFAKALLCCQSDSETHRQLWWNVFVLHFWYDACVQSFLYRHFELSLRSSFFFSHMNMCS